MSGISPLHPQMEPILVAGERLYSQFLVLLGADALAGKRLFNIPVKCANELIYAPIMEVYDAKMG